MTFERASGSDAEKVYTLTEARVAWMDQTGIRQWNVTNYLEAYPLSYYEEKQNLGCLYALKDEGEVTGAAVLLEEDERWQDRAEETAYYLHNLVTDPTVKGAGNVILEEAERMARERGKTCLRLDCAADNAFLNSYYEAHGYRIAGRCSEGLYVGNRREKRLEG